MKREGGRTQYWRYTAYHEEDHCKLSGAVAGADSPFRPGDGRGQACGIVGAEYPIYMKTTDTGVTMTLYFLDGVNDLPYVDADGLVFLLEGLMDFKCTVSTEGSVATYNRFNEWVVTDIPMTFDFDRNVIFFPDYDLFCMKGNASSIMDTARLSGFNAEGAPSILQKVDNGTLVRFGKAVEINMGTTAST